MRKMTRTAAVILCLIMVFSLTACNLAGYVQAIKDLVNSRESTEEPAATKPTKPAPTGSSKTEPAPTESATAQPVPTEPAPTEPAPTQPAPTEPAPTEPAPTEPSVPVQELSAAEAYARAVSAFPSDYRMIYTSELTRKINKETLVTADQRERLVRGEGSGNASVHEEWFRSVEGNFADRSWTYTTDYANGQALMVRDGAMFVAEQSEEEFLSGLIPRAMLTEDNYETIEWADEAHTKIRFTDPVDTEWEWIGMDCTDITDAEALVILDADGQISEILYDAEYDLEAVHFIFSCDATFTPLPAAFPAVPASSGAVSVSDVRIVPLMDLADSGHVAEDLTVSLIQFDMSYAAGGEILQEWVATGRQGDDYLLYDYAYLMSAFQDTTESRLRYADGELEYTVDDEAEPFDGFDPGDVEDSLLDYIIAYWTLPEEMESAVLSDEEDCWLIEFKLPPAQGKAICRELEQKLLGSENYLERMYGGVYQFNSYKGVLSIDKTTGYPLHLYVKYSGQHRIYGNDYLLEREYELRYNCADPEIYSTVTERLEETEAPDDPATPLFYQVKDSEGHTMWLLGTIHVGDYKTAHLPQEIYDALLSSDALAVEIDTSDMEERLDADEELMKAYQEATYYSDGSTIYDHLDDKEAEKVRTALKKYGGIMHAEVFNYKLASVSSLLDQYMVECSKDLSYDRGVDNQLVDMAKANGIPVWDVEDYKEHITLLGSYSEELQALLLIENIDGGRYGSYLGTRRLYDLWCEGDEEAVTAALNGEEEEDEELTPEEQALVDEYNYAMMEKRNAEMVAKAKEYLASGKTVFFAVGTAHLVDEDGLLICLREAGYTVERVTYSGAFRE